LDGGEESAQVVLVVVSLMTQKNGEDVDEAEAEVA
jgi:hypothetical protein